MGATATQRVEVAISSTEYDLAIAKDIAERVSARLLAGGKNNVQIGATADVALSKTKDESAIWTRSRIVVVLHERLWGKTPATALAATALTERKAKSTAKSIRVIRLDDAPLPSCLRGADARQISQGLDTIAEWIAAAVGSAGGAVKKTQQKAKVVAAADASNRRADAAATFLGSSRAVAVCAREFERLADGIAKRAATIGDKTGTKAEVQRMPDRCIVQLGPVALSVSWVRERVDTVATGRLMIAEWNGRVMRGAQPAEPMPAPPIVRPGPATLVRENILRADATGEPDWLWRREAADHGYASRDLAARCVESLVLSLQETAS